MINADEERLQPGKIAERSDAMLKTKSLRVLVLDGQYDLAAHRLVYGLVKAKKEEMERNGKGKSDVEKPAKCR